MANVTKAGNNVIELIFFAFLAGILAMNLSSQNISTDYNWIESNKTIIQLVFLVLFLVILKNAFGSKN